MSKDRAYNWSNACSNIKRGCDKNSCACYFDYVAFTKDEDVLDFDSWKQLVIIEMES